MSARWGTALYQVKTPPQRIGEVLSAVAEGLDIAAAVRVFGHGEGTITRWLARAGRHAERLHERLFEDIAWSTDRVLAQTLERAAEIGVDVALMPEWYDVDDAASLARLRSELLSPVRPSGLMPFAAPHSRAHLCSGSGSTRIDISTL